MSGTVTITPGYEFPSDSTAITKARLNLLANPTAQVAAGAITARELSSTILPFDPTIQTILFEDFAVDTGIANVIGANNLPIMVNGAGATVTFGTSTASHPGTALFTDTSAATGYCFIRWPTSANGPVVLGGGSVEITWLVGNLSALSDATNDYSLYIGLGQAGSGLEPTDGVYFAYNYTVNSGNWVCKTSKVSSRDSLNSSVAVATSSWYALKAVINAAGNSVAFYINGTSIGTLSDTTKIPAISIAPMCGMRTTTGTATSITFQADYVKLVQNFTVAR